VDFTVASKTAFAATGGADFEAEKPLVVFVHGVSLNRTSWSLQTRYFAHHGYNVLAVDLPGHGRSEGPALASIEEMADWLAALIDATGVGRASVIGHSMGSFVALQWAATHPKQATKIVVLGVAEAMPVHPELLAAAERQDPLAYELMMGWSLAAASHRGSHEQPGMWMLDGGIRLFRDNPPEVVSIDLNACATYQGAVAAAGRITCPTLFLLGAEDKMTPVRGARSVIESMANCEVRILPGTGHFIQVEQARTTIAVLSTFLETSS